MSGAIAFKKETFTPNWGCVVCHDRNAQGADAYNNCYTEYIYGIVLAKYLNIPYFTKSNYDTRYIVKSMIKKNKVNCIIEPHYNAFNGKTEGAEVLVLKGDRLSEKYAELLLSMFKDKYPNRRVRGIRLISRKDRGYKNLKDSKGAGAKVAILTELFFGDNFSDFMPPSEQAELLRSFFAKSSNNQQVNFQP